MKRDFPLPRLLAFAATLSLLICAKTGLAEEGPAAGPVPKAPSVAEDTISSPGLQLIRVGETLAQSIHRLKEQQRLIEQTLDERVELKQIGEALLAEKQRINQAQRTETTLALLIEVEQRLDHDLELLNEDDETLSELLKRFEGDLRRFEESGETIQRDLQKMKKEALPASLNTFAREMGKRFNENRSGFSQTHNRLLTTLLELSQQRQLALTLKEDLNHRRELMGALMRSLNALPLWRSAGTVTTSQLEDARETLHQWLFQAGGYLRSHLGFWLLWLCGWAAAIRFTFRRAESYLRSELSYATITQGALIALSRPLISGWFITLLSIFLFLPGGPVAFVDVVWLLMLFPAVLLLQARLAKRGWWTPRLLGLVIAFFPFRISLEAIPFLDRCVLGFQGALIAFTLARDLRHSRHDRHLIHGGIQLVVGGLILGLVLATLANLWGQVGVSRLMIDGLIGSMGYAMGYSIGRDIFFTMAVGFLQTRIARGLRLVRTRFRGVVYGVYRLLTWIMLAGFIDSCLDASRVKPEILAGFFDLWSYQITLGSTSIAIKNLLVSLGLIWVTRFLLRHSRTLMEVEVLPRFRLSKGSETAVSTLVRYFVGLSGFILATLALGIDLSKVTILAGALGVGIGFGLQNIVNNFISGLILLFEHPVHVDDVIELGSLRGTIIRIGIRSSTLRTAAGAEVIVPNSDLIAREVINWTLSDRQRRLEIRVGVAYGTDVDRVLVLLKRVAEEAPTVLDEPQPLALFTGFGESSLDFQLNAWVDRFEDSLEIASDLHVRLNRALAEEGIEIPFPQRDLNIRTPAPGGAPLIVSGGR